MELRLDLPAAGSRGRIADLHRQIRAAIIDGPLAAGVRLPTTRELAQTLGVSRNTVVAAYDYLTSEGYLVSRQRAGTFVAETTPLRRQAKTAAARSCWNSRAGTGCWSSRTTTTASSASAAGRSMHCIRWTSAAWCSMSAPSRR